VVGLPERLEPLADLVDVGQDVLDEHERELESRAVVAVDRLAVQIPDVPLHGLEPLVEREPVVRGLEQPLPELAELVRHGEHVEDLVVELVRLADAPVAGLVDELDLGEEDGLEGAPVPVLADQLFRPHGLLGERLLLPGLDLVPVLLQDTLIHLNSSSLDTVPRPGGNTSI
jgi:hypothetical protein